MNGQVSLVEGGHISADCASFSPAIFQALAMSGLLKHRLLGPSPKVYSEGQREVEPETWPT